jgi:hypothetical protein
MSTPWEYKVILSQGISDQRLLEWEKDLNKYGADGWELVSVIVRPEVPREEAPTVPREDAEEYRAAVARAASFPSERHPRTVIFLKRERS